MMVASTFTILPLRLAICLAAPPRKILLGAILPARVGVREKVADVRLAKRRPGARRKWRA